MDVKDVFNQPIAVVMESLRRRLGLSESYRVGIPDCELITGCMFGGKTKLLAERINRARGRGLDVSVFKFQVADKEGNITLDEDSTYLAPRNVYVEAPVITDSGKTVYLDVPLKIPSIVVPHDKPEQILEDLEHKAGFVAVDEAHFSPDYVEVAKELMSRGYKVCSAGLDRDFRNKPFESTVNLARLVTPLNVRYVDDAICWYPTFNEVTKLGGSCNGRARFTKKYIARKRELVPAPLDSELLVVKGTKGVEYKSECAKHYFNRDKVRRRN